MHKGFLFTMMRSVIAAPVKFPSCAVNVEGWSDPQCETANEDRLGQDSPGPDITHLQDDIAL